MVFEFVFFFVFLFVLGLWLLIRETVCEWQLVRRARYVNELLATFEGRGVTKAEQVLGPPAEIVTGSSGRSLYVWKAPDSKEIPKASTLLIVTLAVDDGGIVTHVAWEQR